MEIVNETVTTSIVRVKGELLASLLTKGAEHPPMRVVKGLPEGARLIGTHMSSDMPDVLELTFVHDMPNKRGEIEVVIERTDA